MAGTSFVEKGLLLCIVAVIVVALLAITGPMIDALQRVVHTTTASHGLARHPDTYPEAMKCFNNPEAHLYTMVVKPSKKVDICALGSLFYFRVWQKRGGNGNSTWWDEITAYHREEIESLVQLNEYAKDSGYQLYKGIVDVIPMVH